MDRAGTEFRDMTASIDQIDYTAVIQDTTRETGKVAIKKTRGAQMLMRVDLSSPDPKTATFNGDKAEVYYPQIQTVQVWNLGRYRNLVDQFLLLGFGSPISELKKNYGVRLMGTEAIEGEVTTHLELVPKSAEAKQYLSSVELWINTRGYPLRQKFNFPSGDYKQVTYKNMRINVGISDAAVKFTAPPGVKRVHPDK